MAMAVKDCFRFAGTFPKVLLLMLLMATVLVFLLTHYSEIIDINGTRWQAISNFRGEAKADDTVILRFESTPEKGTGGSDDVISSLQCAFPHADPFDKDVMRIAGLDRGTLQCQGHSPDLTYLDKDKLVVNTTMFKSQLAAITNVTCQYRDVLRNQFSDAHITFGKWSDGFTESAPLPKSAEFLHVTCKNGNQDVISNSYYELIPKRDEWTEMYSILSKKRQKRAAPKETLSVIMIGFDGVSRYQFLRAMTKTYTYLTGDLKSFDMTMHTQVGKDTFENFLCLFTGQPIGETLAWWDFAKYTDAFDLVWQSFEKAGYRTLYTEDLPTGGAFHYQKKGFMNAQTSYNSRPIALAIQRDKQIWRAGQHCVGNKPELLHHVDYVKRFFDTFPNSPLFASAFLTKLTHDDMTYLKMADEHLLSIYEELFRLGHLNRSLLITYSDHGPRVGPIRTSFNGMVESRTPYAIFTFPQWFLEKYPDVARNLRTNTRRLTTHLDTHATLRDLMYFKSEGEVPLKPNKHGISLFREIPKNRTCEDVPIPREFCLCNQQTVRAMDVNASLSKHLADQVMAALSLKVNKTHCSKLKIDKILKVLNINFTKTLSVEIKNKMLFKVWLQTVPGKGIFEGTVFVSGDQVASAASTGNLGKVDVGDVIERLNMYRGQAECVHDANQRLFCFCKAPFEKDKD